jgi:hypothetical protein
MSEAERRELIRRYWEVTASDQDQDITHEIYHDDAILEFPQSGERFEGVANFQEWRSRYPASVTLEMRNLRGQGDLGEHPRVPGRQGRPGNDLRHRAVGGAGVARPVAGGAVGLSHRKPKA